MKTCMKCGAEKDLSHFYKHKKMADGYLNKCKECTKKDVRENRRDKADYYRAYDAQRYQDDPQVKERHLRYQKTPAGKASLKKSTQRYRRANPEKYKAHSALNNAKKKGLIKEEPCVRCGEKKVEAHHPDYSKPLEVVWLCRKHHLEEHRL